jgi:putative ABC transport system substrate-binding protein
MSIQGIAISDPLVSPISSTENRQYGPVKEGQSLWNIAKELRTDNTITLHQMLVALWSLNPQAFSKPCNPHSLKVKVFLNIPDKAAITALSPKEAQAILQRQIEAVVSGTEPSCAMSPTSDKPKVLPTEQTISLVTDSGKKNLPTPVEQQKVSPVTTPEKTALPPAEQPSEGLHWLELGKDVLQNWDAVIPSSEKNAWMKITPKWKKTPEQWSKKIFGLIPKPSDSYSLASSKLLQVLYDEGIYADIILINFNKNNELGKYALNLAEQENTDLIFSMGSESAAFLHEFYRGGKIPVVTCTNKDPVLLNQMADYENGSGTNIAYTSLNVPIDIQINYLIDFIPGLKNLGILYDRNHAQVVATEVIPTRNKLNEMGINVIDIEVSSAETAKEELLNNIAVAISVMQQNDPSLRQSAFWVTSSTLVFSNMATVTQASSTIAILGSIPNIVTGGADSAVMAIGIDRRNNAHLASIYAVKILKGQAQAGELKVGVVTPPDIAINFQVARKINREIPFHLFEGASFIYGYSGNLVRSFGHDTAIQK